MREREGERERGREGGKEGEGGSLCVAVRHGNRVVGVIEWHWLV